jgi:hypothetical protein
MSNDRMKCESKDIEGSDTGLIQGVGLEKLQKKPHRIANMGQKFEYGTELLTI